MNTQDGNTMTGNVNEDITVSDGTMHKRDVATVCDHDSFRAISGESICKEIKETTNDGNAVPAVLEEDNKSDLLNIKEYLHVDEDYNGQFNVETFLINKILNRKQIALEKKQLGVKNDEELIQLILNSLKAKKYIGVGVGGLFIKEIDDVDYVLLYKRYHEPEFGMWSLLGGSGELGKEIEQTLKNKIYRITGIPTEAIMVNDIIRVNNHTGEDYQYLSPTFYVHIKSIEARLCWTRGNQGSKKRVKKIDSLEALSRLKQSTSEKPLLAFVKLDLINDTNLYKGNQLFAFTALRAVEAHKKIRSKLSKVNGAAEQIKDFTQNYQDWRIS